MTTYDNGTTSIKLPVKVKLSYAIGELGKNSLIFFNNYFLLFFYVDILKISAATAASIILITRIWDIINDPLIGIILDKKSPKGQKCRFYFKHFSIPAALFVFLNFFVPDFIGNYKIIWVVAMSIISDVFTSLLLISMNVFIGRLTSDKVERVSLNQYKAVLCIFPGLIIPAITLPLANVLGNNNMRNGFAMVAFIYAFIYAICHLICYFGTNGYERNTDDKIQINKISTKQIITGIIKNKYCLLVCSCYILCLIYISVMNSSLVHYLKYNLGNPNLMVTYSLISNVIVIVPILIMKLLIKRFGNAKSCAIACLIAVTSTLIRLLTRDKNIYILFLCWGLEGVGVGLCTALMIQCMLDSVDYGKIKLGLNNESLTMSTLSFSQKIGQSSGSTLAAFFLSLVPYASGAKTQSYSVLRLFFMENVISGLIIFSILFFIFMYIARLEKEI